MSQLLGGRLRSIRRGARLSQRQMAERLSLEVKAYQRIESGRQHHQERTLSAIDDGMIAAGFDWHKDLAAELDRSDLDPVLLERLDRVEAHQAAILEQLTRMSGEHDLLRRMRQLLAEV